jgi:DnaJ-class molecular chaperone
MDFKDYYQTLGVAKTASEAEIKKAFRKLARESHPDLHAGDAAKEARFKDVNEAYEVLGDPEKRRKYDELGANWRQYEQAAANGGPQAASGWWADRGGSPGGYTYRTADPEHMKDLFGTEDPFSDFFHAFFGGQAAPGRGRRGPARQRRGQDVEHPVDLTLEEAFAGTSRRLHLAGAGRDRTVDVRIPAGVRDGMRVRAAGEGGEGAGGGTAGDLYLRVQVRPHASFERQGQDLRVRVPVPVTTAVLGGEVAVPTLAGTTLRLKVPEMTPAGRVFRLKGHGMPALVKTGERGDLFATVDLQIPPSLSPEEREHYEALKAIGERRP